VGEIPRRAVALTLLLATVPAVVAVRTTVAVAARRTVVAEEAVRTRVTKLLNFRG